MYVYTFESIECNNFSLIDSNVMVIYYSAFIRSSLTLHNQKLYRFDIVTVAIAAVAIVVFAHTLNWFNFPNRLLNRNETDDWEIVLRLECTVIVSNALDETKNGLY